MKGAAEIFRFLVLARAAGERVALVTLTDVIGSSSRAPGTHMAVTETGRSIGSFSGGCIEAAVIVEAQRVIAKGQGESIRFGFGSRFIDIRLPCGGGIDLLITPDPPLRLIEAAREALDGRVGVAIGLDRDGGMALAQGMPPGWHGDRFVAAHEPDLRVLIAGHGAETLALARLAIAYPAITEVLSPEPAILAAASHLGARSHLLLTPTSTDAFDADRWTAIVFLFHDHDWEPDLLMAALETPAFYIGAMGSRRTQYNRLASLIERGARDADLARLAGPIGLIPATRDPDTLALSVLAQIVATQPREAMKGPSRDALMNEAHESMQL